MSFDKEQRRIVFARANAACEHCGAKWSDGVMLEVHHVIPLCDGGINHTDNGELLCRSCHAKAHLRLAKEARKSGNRVSEKNNTKAYHAIKGRSLKRWGF